VRRKGAALTRALAAQTAAAYVEQRTGRVLGVVGATTSVVSALQRHYTTCVLPHVAASFADASHCGSGLLALMKAVRGCTCLSPPARPHPPPV